MKTYPLRGPPMLGLATALGACTSVADVFSPEPPRGTDANGFRQDEALRSASLKLGASRRTKNPSPALRRGVSERALSFGGVRIPSR